MKVVMNRFLLICFLGLIGHLISAQPTCDIGTTGIEAHPSSIHVGQTSQLEFYYWNDAGGDTDCYYDIESIMIIVSIPEIGYGYSQMIEPASGIGPFFTWTYDSVENVVLGINHTKMYDLDVEFVKIEIIGLALPNQDYPRGFFAQVDVTQNPDGPIFPSNDIGNDYGYTTVTILAPLPITLASFDATAESCNRVNLIWKTESELNNDYMEVQRSEDGREFATVGKVKGKNLSGGATYTYTDTEVKSSANYFYRLRQVDFDGKIENHKIISVRTKSCNDDKAFSIHPNPAINILNLGYDGFDNDEMFQCVITNAIGEIVRVYKDMTISSLASIDISTYKPGVYNIQIESNSDTFVKKFVKIY